MLCWFAEWVKTSLNFESRGDVSFFETTIRVLVRVYVCIYIFVCASRGDVSFFETTIGVLVRELHEFQLGHVTCDM